MFCPCPCPLSLGMVGRLLCTYVYDEGVCGVLAFAGRVGVEGAGCMTVGACVDAGALCSDACDCACDCDCEGVKGAGLVACDADVVANMDVFSVSGVLFTLLASALMRALVVAKDRTVGAEIGLRGACDGGPKGVVIPAGLLFGPTDFGALVGIKSGTLAAEFCACIEGDVAVAVAALTIGDMGRLSPRGVMFGVCLVGAGGDPGVDVVGTCGTVRVSGCVAMGTAGFACWGAPVDSPVLLILLLLL
jgi:hypothetical protein